MVHEICTACKERSNRSRLGSSIEFEIMFSGINITFKVILMFIELSFNIFQLFKYYITDNYNTL